MKKVLFTSILLLSAVSFGGNIYAQDTAGGNNTEVTTPSATQPSVKFTADGNTLTISGQGDLTSYMTTDWSAKVFTDKAVGFVFTDDKGTKVNAKDSYNSGKTYYKADYKYTQIFDGGLPTQYSNGFGAVNTVFDETKISNLYSGYHDNNGNIKIEKKVQTSDNPKILGNVTWTYEGKEYYNYFTCDEELSDGTTIALTDLKTKKVGLLDKAGLFGHLKVTYEVYDGKSLFVKHAGSDEKTTLVANKTYIYKSGDLFYEGTATYAAIEDNNAFFDKHTDYVQADDREISFKELLRRKILKGVSVYDYNAKKEVGVSSYTTVKFVNNGSDPLLIDAGVVREILYPTSNGMLTTNVTTTKLDLGEATLNELNADIFIPSQDESYKCHNLALNDITFPKTKLTSVFSESTKQDENKMVLPKQLLSNITGKIKTVSIPEGYDRIADGAFSNENKQSVLENVNLPKGLTLIGKNAFQNCNYIKSIELNEGLENIGESAFSGTTLETVKFPSSLKIINDCAFANCHIYNLKFNAGLKYIGNSAFALSNEHTEKVLEIPASVIYIGPYAFNFRQYQDVYFYGEKAPLMPLGSYKLDISTKDLGTAFPQRTLNGNNGFDPLPKEGEEKTGDDTNSGYANRENYKNHGVYLCMLHYPKGLSDENRDTYTDITRVYKTHRTADGQFIPTDTGKDDATDQVGKEGKNEILNAGLCRSFVKVTWGYADTYLGEQYIWPSHSQFNRAYCTASNSVKWDGVTPVTCDLSSDEIAALKYAGYDTSESNLDELKKIAHMGTRQFVLANADAFVDDKPEEEPTYPINIKGGQWWTICVPFDMTKAQVDNVFGKDTHVCRFNKVERVVNSEKKEKSIKLYFTNDVYVHKSTKDKDGNYTTSTGTPVADDDIVIYAHESYMIYPTKNSDDPNGMYNISDYTLVTGSPLPTLVKANEQFTGGAKESASGDASWNKEYRFVGNYQTEVAVSVSEDAQNSEAVARDIKNVTVPQYSYIYALKKGTSNAQFWFYKGTEMLWGANKCVVQATARDGGLFDYNTYFGGNGSARAKELSFFGTDDEVTGIENVEIIAGNENDTQIVYNLNGQVVNGNLNSLQKGIYIKNGKKFMVK